MQNRWALRKVEDLDAVTRMRHLLGDLPEALARTLVVRGIDTFDKARRFFRSSTEELLDPHLMQDMGTASDRVARAVRDGERVTVYGDFDADGTTACALLVHFLRAKGLDVDFFVPCRFKHGYGLHTDGIEAAIRFGSTLFIAVDCGITDIDEAAYAKSKGLDLIICDHHKVGDVVPVAVAVLNPHRPTCPYPFKGLSACGVAFKLLQAVLQELGESVDAAYEYLDLVALATAIDVVPLKGENRILLRLGKSKMSCTKRPGLQSLARSAKVSLASLKDADLSFKLGPRINAAGRMGDASDAVRLFLAETPEEAGRLTALLEQANDDRKTITARIVAQALRQADEELRKTTRHALVLYRADWHRGVSGIVASRVADQYKRPVVVLSPAEGFAMGSARSVAGVDIYAALKLCANQLITFGGHTQAAGLSMDIENLDTFRDLLSDVVGERMTSERVSPAVEYDADLDLGTVDRRFRKVLCQFGPFGHSNPEPLFVCRGLEILDLRALTNGKHLKLHIRQKDGAPPYEVIAFNHGEKFETMQAARQNHVPVEVLCTLEENVWRGTQKLQLNAKDLRLSR